MSRCVSASVHNAHLRAFFIRVPGNGDPFQAVHRDGCLDPVLVRSYKLGNLFLGRYAGTKVHGLCSDQGIERGTDGCALQVQRGQLKLGTGRSERCLCLFQLGSAQSQFTVEFPCIPHVSHQFPFMSGHILLTHLQFQPGGSRIHRTLLLCLDKPVVLIEDLCNLSSLLQVASFDKFRTHAYDLTCHLGFQRNLPGRGNGSHGLHHNLMRRMLHLHGLHHCSGRYRYFLISPGGCFLQIPETNDPDEQDYQRSEYSPDPVKLDVWR